MRSTLTEQEAAKGSNAAGALLPGHQACAYGWNYMVERKVGLWEEIDK